MARRAARPQPGRRPLILLSALTAGVLLAASLYLWLLGAWQGAPRPAAEIGGPFSLMEDDGRAVTDRDFRGRTLLIYFGYSACRDVCPTTLSALSGALDALGSRAARIQPLFITIDPARDSPAVLHRYLGAISPAWRGLTGSDAAIGQVAAAYRVSIARRPGAQPGEYELDHSSVIYLVGPDGHFVAPIRADDSPIAMARAIARHL